MNKRIAVLLTCHNRRQKTINCFRTLRAMECPPNVNLDYFLVDDGSKDGTAAAVQALVPNVHILQGNGNLYWAGGMRAAWKEAAQSNPDFYLLVNDDTEVVFNALQSVLALSSDPSCATIVVGAICDPVTGNWTYGGTSCDHANFQAGRSRNCRSFNANFVFIPRKVFQTLGIFHSAYTHGLADHDYGYAATRRGLSIRETTEFVGTCSRNSTQQTWRDRSLSRRQRFRLLKSPKGLPFREWFVYCWRNAGPLWPIRVVSPYLRILIGR